MTQPTPSTPGRPGQMTAVMRAVSANTGPKVLRIGLVQSGKVIEERVIKQRSTVTIGPSEKNTFVILAPNIPASFKILELINNEYYLSFVDGMTGRIALQTGPTDLSALKGQAKKSQQGAYQVKLTDDSHGKVVLGETTLLFQFVAPPPVQPKPQLPASVRSGVADQIDWSMTIIAAFSFLFHFGAVGTLYSDWADKVIPDEADVRGLVEQINRLPPPPPVEQPTTTDTATATAAATAKAEAPKQSSGGSSSAKSGGGGAGGQKMSASKGAALLNQLDAMNTATIAAVSAGGSATRGVLESGNVPTGSLDSFANSSSGAQAGGPGGLKMGEGGGGPVIPGQEGGGLAGLGRNQGRRSR
ncbi:MAG: energy transducer TonB [Polyangiaceae bacterium]